MKLMMAAQARQQALHRTATVLQRAFRGMKGRQWYEITKNLVAVNRISGPIQNAIRELEDEESLAKQRYTSLETRIRAQEVRTSCLQVCTRILRVSFSTRSRWRDCSGAARAP
jgi:hypothetical protein